MKLARATAVFTASALILVAAKALQSALDLGDALRSVGNTEQAFPTSRPMTLADMEAAYEHAEKATLN